MFLGHLEALKGCILREVWRTWLQDSNYVIKIDPVKGGRGFLEQKEASSLSGSLVPKSLFALAS